MTVTSASALVQAASAGIIAVLTILLVRHTKRYTEETKKLALEARQSNALAERNTDLTIRRLSGILVVKESGVRHTRPGEPFEFSYVVKNVGDGLAHLAAVHFEEFAGVDVDRTLRTGEEGVATVAIDEADVADTPTHPNVVGVTFMDATGTWWEQPRRGSGEGAHLGPPRLLEEG